MVKAQRMTPLVGHQPVDIVGGLDGRHVQRDIGIDDGALIVVLHIPVVGPGAERRVERSPPHYTCTVRLWTVDWIVLDIVRRDGRFSVIHISDPALCGPPVQRIGQLRDHAGLVGGQ
jgi:hypothetical protein